MHVDSLPFTSGPEFSHKIGKYTKDTMSAMYEGRVSFCLCYIVQGRSVATSGNIFVKTHCYFLISSGFMVGGLGLSISHSVSFFPTHENHVLYKIISRLINKLKYFHVTFFFPHQKS